LLGLPKENLGTRTDV